VGGGAACLAQLSRGDTLFLGNRQCSDLRGALLLDGVHLLLPNAVLFRHYPSLSTHIEMVHVNVMIQILLRSIAFVTYVDSLPLL
jgi:hypothetical protein